MSRAPTPCLEIRCYETATYRGRCPKHKQAWKGSTRRERLPDDWQARRSIVLRRDNGICYICEEPGADGVDHLVAGDDHDLENLAAIHHNVPPYCHRFKSSAEGTAAQYGERYNPFY